MSTGGGAAMDLAEAVVSIIADTSLLQKQVAQMHRQLQSLQGSLQAGTDPDEATDNLDDIGDKFTDMIAGVMNALRGGISNILGLIGGGVLTASIAAAVSQFVSMAGAVETSTQTFETMIGNLGEAKGLMQEISLFAAKTPFRMPELEQAVRGMMLYGFSAKQAVKEVKMLGDIAAISQTPIQELATLYAQMKSMGPNAPIGSELIGMLTNRGIISRMDIAKELGISQTALMDRMSKGMLRWKQIEPIFQKLTQEGGRFYKGMERQSQTYAGLASTLSDNLSLVGARIGMLFIEQAKAMQRAAIAVTDTIRQWMEALIEFNARTGGFVSRLATALAVAAGIVMIAPRVTLAVNLMAKAIQLATVSTGWGVVIVALGVVIALAMQFGSMLNNALNKGQQFSRLGQIFKRLWEQIKQISDVFGTRFMQAIRPAIEFVEKSFGGLVEFLDKNMGVIADVVQSWAMIIGDMIAMGMEVGLLAIEHIAAVVNAILFAVMGDVQVSLSDVAQKLLGMLREHAEWAAAYASEMAEALAFFSVFLRAHLSEMSDIVGSMLKVWQTFWGAVFDMARIAGESISKILQAALTGNLSGVLAEVVGEMTNVGQEAVGKMTEAMAYQSDKTKELKKEWEDAKDNYDGWNPAAKKKQIEEKRGQIFASQAAKDAAAGLFGGATGSDKSQGGGMLMRAGFLALEQATKDMQQILLDESRGDQTLGVMQDLLGVQKEALEFAKKGAGGVGEGAAAAG